MLDRVLKRFITKADEKLLQEEQHALNELRVALARLEAVPDDLELLGRAIRQLDELFLLVIVGEFNSGKSAFINALLGSRFLTEGVTPTTTQIHILRYGEEARQTESEDQILVITYPVAW